MFELQYAIALTVFFLICFPFLAQKFRLPLLLILSILYAWLLHSALLFGLFLFSSLLTYFFSIFVFRKRSKALPFVCGYISVCLMLFLVIKAGFLSLGQQVVLANNALPLGFSFFCFFNIAYLLDLSREEKMPLASPQEFFLGVSFFPVQTMGPFFRLQNFSEQMREKKSKNFLLEGYFISCAGLFKLGFSGLISQEVVRQIPYSFIDLPQGMNPLGLLLICSLYLYANFSGYSDVVIGLGRLTGFKLPENFEYPFTAKSMAEFWRAWHISLGVFFRDYVFYPINYFLQKKLSPKTSTNIALFGLFFLIGIWHGLEVKFFLWAFINFVFVALEWDRFLPRKISWLVTFLAILSVNALFLAKDLESFGQFLSALFSSRVLNFNSANLRFCLFAVVGFFLLYLIDEICTKKAKSWEGEYSKKYLVLGALLAFVFAYFGIVLAAGRMDFVYSGF